MNALASSHSAEASTLVPIPVKGDFMAPTLREGRDIALVATDGLYKREGLYVLRDPLGFPKFYRLSCCFKKGFVWLHGDNKLYWPGDRSKPPQDLWTREAFFAELIGEVRGIVHLYDPSDWRSYVDVLEGRA